MACTICFLISVTVLLPNRWMYIYYFFLKKLSCIYSVNHECKKKTDVKEKESCVGIICKTYFHNVLYIAKWNDFWTNLPLIFRSAPRIFSWFGDLCCFVNLVLSLKTKSERSTIPECMSQSSWNLDFLLLPDIGHKQQTEYYANDFCAYTDPSPIFKFI